MPPFVRSLPLVEALSVIALYAGLMGTAVSAERRSELVRYDNVQIEVVVEGEGPAVVCCRRWRATDDYDGSQRIDRCGLSRAAAKAAGSAAAPVDDQHLLASRAIAEAVEAREGRAVIVGHAYGSWVAHDGDRPSRLVRGVVVAAAAAKQYAPELTKAVTDAGDLSLSKEARLAALRFDFRAWQRSDSLATGWHPEIRNASAAAAAVRRDEWWPAEPRRCSMLQAKNDPFKPESARNEMKQEFGDRVSIAVIPNASHALIPEQPKAVVDALTTWIKRLP